MSASLPLSLIVSWVLFFGFVNTHQRHARGFRGDSRAYLVALETSVVLGSLVGLALLGYYFTQVSWYWPLVLFVVGGVLGGIAFGALDAKIGQLGMSLLAFAGWPAAAAWCFLTIRDLNL